MGYKNDSYYLINGTPAAMDAVVYPYRDYYVRNVKDISDVDIATISLGTSLKEAIKEVNPNIELTGKNYIVKYPYAKGIKVFKPIEVFKETPTTIKLTDSFMTIAEQRNYNYYHGIGLDEVNIDRILNLVYGILNEMSNRQKIEVFSRDSSLGKKIKDYYYSNKYKFEQQIVNYTQARQLLIDYLHFVAGKRMPNLQELYNVSYNQSNINGLMQEDPTSLTNTLKEYRDKLLKAKNEEEQARLQYELESRLDIPYQMELSDYFPDIPRVDNVINKKTRK